MFSTSSRVISQELTSTRIEVYPNPSNGRTLNILLNGDSSNGTFEMYNLLGRKVLNGNLESGINRIDLPSNTLIGIYIISIKAGVQETKIRVVIN
ncbi:T9SS type A sorting domain-containing protein [Reichenbachiella ulvae]|uniref:T9SS type A sorting domain-containing protein n=1 Tax=Reichenbachiella ulvae TaxID=2980104 RepID=UPI00384E245B